VSVSILESMPLDFKSPFDELTELRASLTMQEIAELTGLRRETLSRARPDSRFQRRTEKALGDLYLVVAKVRSIRGDEAGQLAAILRRPQEQFEGRSIAELLREGEVEAALRGLSERVTSKIGAAAQEDPEPTSFDRNAAREEERRVEALLDADHELRSRLGAIEAAILRHFGPGAEAERKIAGQFDESEGEDDHLYLLVRTDLPFAREIELLGEFREQNEDLLAPTWGKLLIGTLG
jgi:hypothetical protein